MPSRFSGGGGATPSFQDLLRNSTASPGRPQPGRNAGDSKPFSLSFDAIRESLHKTESKQQRPTFLNSLPQNIFGKELQERARKPEEGFAKEEEDSGILLSRDYSYEELGKKLGELRPSGAGKDGKEWFSLEELQGRIAKLAELEKRHEDPRFGGEYAMLRSSIRNIKKNEDRKIIKTVQNLSLFSNIGGKPTPEYELRNLPPQEELLERYFHPDHMSGEEKMKLELQKVRDEFKMSENDCGSARVQIAQLTLKIKHLSSVLHKKDKHSRKGLQDMVQRRKKYLKYLRRTDWDSYCLVLSKLGLRDVPEYKAPDYKKTQPTKAQSKKSKSKRKRKMKA